MSAQKLDSSQLYGFPITELDTATAEEVASGITLPVIVSNGSVLSYKVVATKTWSDYVATTTSAAIATWNGQVSTAVSAANTAVSAANTARDNAQKAADAANGKIQALDAAVSKANELTDNVSKMEQRVSDVGSVIDKANTATANANAAAQSVDAAKNSAATATQNATAAAASANSAAKAATEATDKANTATKNADDATALAHTATTAANNASSDAQTAESQRADAEKQRAAAEQQRAATFKDLADGNAATITEMQRIAASISNAQGAVPMSSVPASICVEADFTAVAGGTVNVSPSFFVPRGCNGSVMYHVVSGNATTHLNGEVTLPSESGDICVEVIPALNNMAGKVVTIHVTAPTPLLDLSGEEITDEKGEAITV